MTADQGPAAQRAPDTERSIQPPLRDTPPRDPPGVAADLQVACQLCQRPTLRLLPAPRRPRRSAGLLNLPGNRRGTDKCGRPDRDRGPADRSVQRDCRTTPASQHLTQEDESNLRRHPVIEHLEIFLTEAGLPIEVVQILDSADAHETSTIEILAVNVSIDVKAPPARETTGSRRRQRSALRSQH